MFLHGKQPESTEPDKKKGPLWIIPTSRWKRIHLPTSRSSAKRITALLSRPSTVRTLICFWIGMTAPKQEKWTYTHWHELDIHCHVGTIGAVFDFFAGTYLTCPEVVAEAFIGMALPPDKRTTPHVAQIYYR